MKTTLIYQASLALAIVALAISGLMPIAGQASEPPSHVEVVVLEYHMLEVPPDVDYVDLEPKNLYYQLHFQLQNRETNRVLHNVEINITDISHMPIDPDTGEPCPECELWPQPTSFGTNWIYWYAGDLSGSQEFWDWYHIFWKDPRRTYTESLGFSAERTYEPKYIPADKNSIVQVVTLTIKPLDEDKWLHAGVAYEQSLISAKILDYNYKDKVNVLKPNEIEWIIEPPLTEDVYMFQIQVELARKPGVIGSIRVIPWCRADLRDVRTVDLPSMSNINAILEDGILTIKVSDNPSWHIMYESPSRTVFFQSYENVIQEIEASVDIEPDTLNLKSNGKWITGYIELPEGYSVKDIDVSTILLNNTVPALEKPVNIGDYDNDGILDLMIKFDRSMVMKIVKPGQQWITFEVSGMVQGIHFKGFDTIKIISKE